MKKLSPLYIAAIYIIVSLLWILISDRFVFIFEHKVDKHTFFLINSIKGVVFVIVSGILIYILTLYSNRQIIKNGFEYRTMYESNPNPMWIYELDSLKFISVNNAAIEFYGYSRDEFLKMTIRDIRPTEDVAKVESAAKNVNMFNKSGIWRHLKKDGSLIYVDISSNKIRIWGEYAVMVLSRDCTDAIEHETQLSQINQSLEQEKRRLSDIQQLSKIAGWELYMEDNTLKLSDEMYAIFNADPKAVVADYELLLKIIHTADLDRFLNAIKTTIKDGTDFDIIHRLYLRSEVKYVRQLGKLEYQDGKPFKIRGTMQDITELKQIETERNKISDENKRLGTIVTRINNMVVILNTESRITWVNKAFENFTGYTLNEVAGKKPSQFMWGPDTNPNDIDFVDNAERNREVFSVDLINYTKTGQKYWVNIEFTPLFDDDNTFIGYIAIQNDITIRKEKEDEILKQNTILRDVAWLSSHELRRPVASILGLMQLIKDAENEGEKEQYVDFLDQCTVQLDDIIHNINRTIETETSIRNN
ncbi:PAS domain S-box protein [Mucilaginibacter sp. HMF5004]|uniref:PAS domain S-box protein n=1 Tax=Mucilaginibacter rivuli TaxID=2857527 RepID=UPI001C5EA968|nr:PAS domain S-box protein [Mucilaginibacter rivuli]MBW4889320.1 PAS domain S-box protein [Mucilaginibacter rivuli]